MYDLPTSIYIGDKEFKIRNSGDFRVVLDCFSALEDIELGEDFGILASLIIFYEDFDEETVPTLDEDTIKQLILEMYKFFNCGKEDNSDAPNNKLIDWEQDSQIIMAAVNNVAGKEIRQEEFVHWWTFVGYYMSIGESVLATVVSIRNKILRNETLEKWEKKFKAENEHYFHWNSKSRDERELDQEFEMLRNAWNNGSVAGESDGT